MKINGRVYPKKNTNHVRFFVRFNWTSCGKAFQKKLSTPFRCHRTDYDFKRMLVTGKSLEATTVRDRIFLLEDFISKLDRPTQEENIDAARDYLGLPVAGTDEEIRMDDIRDFIRAFVRMNKNKYAFHSLRRYGTLEHNITMFAIKYKLTCSFKAMSIDKQRAWFSKYVDFVVFDDAKLIIGDDVFTKSPSTNAYVRDEFKRINVIKNAFSDTGIKVDLLGFVNGLRTGTTTRPYCTLEEVFEIYRYVQGNALSPMEEKAGDLFVFQSLTGLRYNELYNVEPNNITQKMVKDLSFPVLVQTANKTGTQNTVPLHEVCMAIIQKWASRKDSVDHFRHTVEKGFPECSLPVISGQKYNKGLHSLLQRLPGMQKVEKVVRYQGPKRIETERPRYMGITTHCARHTFSFIMTNAGMSLAETGQLLNHANPETTNKYYKHILDDEVQYKALKALKN